MNPVIRQKLASLPKNPGVYFMKGSRGQVLYVGKAKDLKNRVSSYFTDSKDHSPKTRSLVREIVDFEIMLVKTEVEALLLERTLIKHHQPPFNILLRDDKDYPFVRVDFKNDWPRLEITRKRADDGAEYFGPFSASRSLRTSLEAIKRVFPLIRCSPWEFQHAKRVCNYYHMKLCLGPCVLNVDKDEYKAMIRHAMTLLEGKNQEVVHILTEKMQLASSRELYELAASYRDQIKAVQVLSEKQSVIFDPEIEGDVLATICNEDFYTVHVSMIRGGKLLGGDSFSFPLSATQDPSSVIQQFLLQYYDGRHIPKRMILDVDLENSTDLADALTPEGFHKPEIRSIKNLRSPWTDLMDISQKNARYAQDEAIRSGDRRRSTLEALQQTLQLPQIPHRIECIDISNLQGNAIVASNVCFMNGHPDKSLYRIYNVETVQNAPDDFASIREVVKRRLERGIRDNDLPDLLIIDGGRGQLASALASLEEFPGLSLQIVSLAKSRVQKYRGEKSKVSLMDPRHSLERVFVPGKDLPIPLVAGSPTFRILTQLRDEAHRFAITKHRAKRSKLSQKSILEEIPGVGPKLRVKLLKHFGSMENLQHANEDAISLVPGVTHDLAIQIKKHLKKS